MLTTKLKDREINVSYLDVLHCSIYYYKINLPFVNFQTISDVFTMDENYVNPLKVVYKYDETKLEDIELPSILMLDAFLTKI